MLRLRLVSSLRNGPSGRMDSSLQACWVGWSGSGVVPLPTAPASVFFTSLRRAALVVSVLVGGR